MARPIGSKGKRNDNKYILPDGVKLKENQNDYNKLTKLIFIDEKYGEFISSFIALTQCGKSTHPLAVKERRDLTNLVKYGHINPGANKEVQNKKHNTMVELYGVKHALLKKEFIEKSKNTLKENFNVENPMYAEVIKNKQITTLMENYGVKNPMKNSEIKEKFKKDFNKKYGVDNPAKLPNNKEKYFASITKNGNIRSSEGELEIKEFVETLGFECHNGYLGGSNPKQIDIKINEISVGIEYNGAYWHSSANKSMHKNYHLEKFQVARNNGMKLIQIFDYEWKFRKYQIKSFLKSSLGKNEIKIPAKETEIVELNKEETDLFLNQYHILGKVNFLYSFGLKYNNEIVCLLTLGLHHRNNKELVLSRYCGKENITVQGGLGKLTKFIVEKFGDVTTWIDLRFSNGDGWIKAGWELIHQLPPDYIYLNIKTGQIVNKQSRKKSLVGTPDELTESDHAEIDGLKKIYDCGKLKLIYRKC